MMRRWLTGLALGAALSVPAAAQLVPGVSLPPVQLPEIPLRQTLDQAGSALTVTARQLLDLRNQRIDRLLRRNSELIERDARGEPARRGEMLLLDPSPSALAAAEQAGFTVGGSERLANLDIEVVQLALPKGTSLAEAEKLLARVAPDAEIAPDNLHFQSGAVATSLTASAARAASPPAILTKVGIIDGGPGNQPGIVSAKGFAKGAPMASDHGSAVASLLETAGAGKLYAADVYGNDPAGGNALAIAKALDWLAGSGVKVVSVSLSGPANTIVGKAVAAAQRKGLLVVAAVGNDGPAAPPSYPASYPGVVAVTAVDGRARPLIEAGKALHLDYAAPGADIRARSKSGKWGKVRGTSFAVPLVAARAAAAFDRNAAWRSALDREAEDLGQKGADDRFGRGLLCRGCGRR